MSPYKNCRAGQAHAASKLALAISALQVVDAIRHAGTDDQVIGLVTHIGDLENALQGYRLADIQALRAALLSFR